VARDRAGSFNQRGKQYRAAGKEEERNINRKRSSDHHVLKDAENFNLETLAQKGDFLDMKGSRRGEGLG